MTRTGLDRPIYLTYLITDLEIGGVPLHLYRLITCLPRKEVRARVISLADEGPVGHKLREAGIPVHACGARSVTDFDALLRLWRLLRAYPPDILHSLLFHANMAARVIGFLAGVPTSRIISEIQTVEIERRWHLIADTLTCRWSRCEVGNSPSVVEHLHRVAHLPRSRLVVIRGGVEVESFASAIPADRALLGCQSDEKVIIWTGRLDPVKGFEQMLAAFAEVSKSRHVRFLLVGEGSYRAAIAELIRHHRLTGRAQLLGQREDVPRLLKSADLFLFGSRTEGLPNALLEAMAAGLPIVATDVSGCRDLIQHDQTGLLVPAGSSRAMAAAVGRLLDDPLMARRLGQNARQWTMQNAAIDAIGNAWLTLYRTLQGERVSRSRC
ncbi:MAG: glycosyltransferase [Phycisphaerales bacterium]|nr:glycosyltransferase [Phycisphaerales bacterium]